MTPAPTPGHATPEGTRRYADRHAASTAPHHFRDALGLRVSSIGLGTYLGEATDAVGEGYRTSAMKCLASGVNVLDTAANYRGGRSERDLGEALATAFQEGIVQRDEVLVTTKAGYLPLTGREEDPVAWYRERYVEPGVARMEDLVEGVHVMTPTYLQHELKKSLAALQLDSVDVFFVHNPETQRQAVGVEEFEDRLLEAFEYLEEEANHGRFQTYGLATWHGFLAPPEHAAHLSLTRIYALAQEAAERVGAPRTRFGAIELPVNLGMTHAVSQPTQEWQESLAPLLYVARELGLLTLASASLMQARLIGRLPADLQARLGMTTDAQRALQFTRSVPGVTTALVGMSNPEHVEENLAVARTEPLELG